VPDPRDLLRRPPTLPDPTPEQLAEQERRGQERLANLPPWQRRTEQGAEAMIDALLGAIGVKDDNLASVVGNVGMAILPMGSWIRNPALRTAALERLAARAPEGAAREAVAAAAKKYPRLMAHVEDVRPIGLGERGKTVGSMTPSVEKVKGVAEPRVRLNLNPHISSADMTQNVAHELQHTADFVRTSDRARQAGITESPDDLFAELYRRAEGPGGYDRNPFEGRARVAQEASTMDRTPGRIKNATDRARDPLQVELNTQRSLGHWDEVVKLLERQAMSPATSRMTEAPPMLAELLRRLDPRFR
jgi:hypothetical protein